MARAARSRKNRKRISHGSTRTFDGLWRANLAMFRTEDGQYVKIHREQVIELAKMFGLVCVVSTASTRRLAVAAGVAGAAAAPSRCGPPPRKSRGASKRNRK
jgi:hypothetical protein